MNSIRGLAFLVIAVVVVCAATTARVALAAEAPNIVWIVAEDMSANMSCYGETVIRTPNIDRLANEGVRFSRAFVTAPVCSPSRSALITGMYQTTIGAHHHRSSRRGQPAIHLPPKVKLLPEYFKQRGYHTSLGGAPEASAKRAPRKQLGKSDYNFVWDQRVYDGNDWSGRKPGQPFFAQIMLRGGKNRGAKVPNPVDPADVKLPPYYPDHPVLREDWAKYLNSVIKTDMEVGEVLRRLEEEKLSDNTVIVFLTDHGISHVRDKQFLYEGGIHIPLIIRWPQRIKPGTVRDDLVLHIDLSATTLAMAEIPIPDHLEGRPLLADDFKPRDHVVVARDRCDETVDRIRGVRTERFKYIRNFHPQRSHAQPNRYKDAKPIMVTMRELHEQGKLSPEQARVFDPTRPEEELYDLREDPFEVHNLAADARHDATLKEMRAKLQQWIESTGDLGQFPEQKEAIEAPVSAVMSPAVAEVPIPPPPATPERPVTDTLHGTTVTDPYRWLEGNAKGEVTDEVAKWTDAHNARTRAVLDRLPGRASIESRLRELMEVTAVSAPKMARNRYFHTKRQGKQNQAVLYVRDGHDGASRVLLDPNTLDKDGLVTLDWSEPNHDGTLLAFGTYRAGDENTVCHVLDVDTGKWREDRIEGKVGEVYWTPDSSGFFYRRLADLKNPYSGQIKFHRLGTDAKDEALLFEQYKDGPLATTWGPFAHVSRDGRWMILGYFTSTKSNDLWVVDLDRWFRTGVFAPVEIVTGADARFDGHVNGDTLLMSTTLDASNGRVFAVDLHHPQRERWREIIPERKDAPIEEVELARGVLAVNYQKNATTQIRLFDLGGRELGELELPGIGTGALRAEPDRTEAFLTFTSFNTPPTIYRLDLASPAARSVWDKPDVPIDPSSVEVKQVFYPSKDGTRVSMFLVHKKGLTLDGNNPTLLSGYGGFANSMTPWFTATLFPWFEAGGVYAIPNLRGGGEYGETWHAGGMLERKQNSFDDFLAAAEWLIANRYTNPKRLAILGGSNGGLLVGAAITQRPDLFAAAVSAVPLLDMLRYQEFLMARYWVPEYGSAEDAEQFKYLIKYSPYHHVKPETEYPAVFLTAGENDTRVHPLHARKMAARLLAASAGRDEANPVLLWVDRDAGHGQGKPLNLRVRDAADVRMFIMWQLGMLPAAPSTAPVAGGS